MNIVDWLLDSDPAVRWQVLQDIVHAPAAEVVAERVRVAREGWGAKLLALQGADGQWAGGACFPGGTFTADEPEDLGEERSQGQPWTSTLPVLHLLCLFGVDPEEPTVRAAIEGVRTGCRWEHAGQPFFEGEVEPCINGRTVAIGVYFGQEASGIVDRLLGEQLEDGGWNCEAEFGSVRSSFATTINVLEGLLAYERAERAERATDDTAALRAARRRGEEYLLERALFRRKSTGEVVDPAWLELSFPPHWHYDVLRALDYFRLAGGTPDPRLADAVDHIRRRRQRDGTWLLENTHPGAVHFATDDGDGLPSRWNTLRALRVLDWYDGSRH